MVDLMKQTFKQSYRYFLTMGMLVMILAVFYHLFSIPTGLEDGQTIIHNFMMIGVMIYTFSCPLIICKNGYHAINSTMELTIPLKRRTIFLGRYLTGFLFGLVMIILYSFMSEYVSHGGYPWMHIASPLLVAYFFYFQVFTLIYWLCGNRQYYYFLCILLNLTPLILYFTYEVILDSNVRGYLPSTNHDFWPYLAPVFGLSQELEYGIRNGKLYLMCVVLGSIFFLVSMHAFMRRRLEKNGEAVAFDVVGKLLRVFNVSLVSMMLSVYIVYIADHPLISVIGILLVCIVVIWGESIISHQKPKLVKMLVYSVVLAGICFGTQSTIKQALNHYHPKNYEHIILANTDLSRYDEHYVAKENEAAVIELHEAIMNQTDEQDYYQIPLRFMFRYQLNHRTVDRIYYIGIEDVRTNLIPVFEAHPDLFDEYLQMEEIVLEILNGKIEVGYMNVNGYEIPTDDIAICQMLAGALNHRIQEVKDNPMRYIDYMREDSYVEIYSDEGGYYFINSLIGGIVEEHTDAFSSEDAK